MLSFDFSFPIPSSPNPPPRLGYTATLSLGGVFFMGYRAIGPRLNRALTGSKASFWLSLIGTFIEAVVLAITYNIILFADLAHWLIDTVPEGLFVVSVNHASKTHRRFPLGTLVLESMLVTVVAIATIGVYGYVFVNHFIS